MTKQVVNPDGIAAAANNLRTVNNNINNAFETLESAGNKLESNWTGSAGTAAQTTKLQIFQNNTVRSAVLQNYVNLLEQQVSPGYVDTENTNTSLADQFK